MLTIALGIGVYLIATTTLISKDGMSYIGYAKGLEISPLQVIRDSTGYAPRLYTPGYPFLILMIHKLTALFANTTTLASWIYSAQITALLCRIFALIPLYFIGKELVGGKQSFLAMLVLVILPYPARYGSDAIRAWPHILFLATGFLFLIWAAKYKKWMMFGAVGLIAAMGYIVRPVCAQLLLYSTMWITFSLLLPKHKSRISRTKLLGGLALLIIGFTVVAGPYMKARGEILPNRFKQIIKYFVLNSQENNIHQPETFIPTHLEYTAGLSIQKDNVSKALIALISRISDSLMYYFMPALFIGMYYYFRRKPKNEAMFFIAAFFLTNVAMVILRYCMHPDLSKRYILPLIAFTIFFVPLGLQILGRIIDGLLCKTVCKNDISEEGAKKWFLILLVIGLIICLPKLLRPLHSDKNGYRLAANWLKENTTKEDVIIVPDKRITFYAERKGSEYNSYNATLIPLSTTYFVKKTEGDTFLSDIKKYSSLKGLVGYWSANNGTLDYSIYHNNAKAHGSVTYATSKYGQAFNLIADANSYIDCGNNPILNPTDSVTVSAWICPVTSSKGSIVTKNGPYSMEFCADRKIRAGIYAGSQPSWTFVTSESTLSLNTWYHIVMTYDGSYINIYIDGQANGIPTAKSGNMPIIKTPVYIGYGLPGFDHYFDGLIDEVMIFNTALQLDKIKAINEMVKSKTVPTFGTNVNTYPIFDFWKVEKKYSLWMDGQKKKKKLCIYKIE